MLFARRCLSGGKPPGKRGLDAAPTRGNLCRTAQNSGPGFGAAAVNGIQKCHALDQIGPFNRQARTDERPHRMACNIHRTQTKCLDHPRGPRDIFGQARACWQVRAFAMPRHVYCNDMRLKTHLRPPGFGAKTHAVDQQKRLTCARFQHPDGAAVRQPQGS